MSIGVWEPKKADSVALDDLRRYAAGVDGDALTLSADDVTGGAGIMGLDADAWQVADALSDAEIEQLVRFFTLAEMTFPGFEAGKKSPVIPLVKLLKARGQFAPELRRWIKSHTDNRYLPYGSIF